MISTERFNTLWLKNNNECWIWQGSLTSKGYGRIRVGEFSKRAHRVSYELNKGEIPESTHVLHRCDVPSCVNPDHLFLGTDQDNMNDRKDKDRLGFKLTTVDIHNIKDKFYNGETQVQLAREFEVSREHVNRIINEKRW